MEESYHVIGKQPSSILRSALAYARRGIPVFPLRTGTKEPFHGSRGFYDATTDEDEISRLFRYPANIAMRTGQASRILVVDEDRDGSFAELEKEIGPQPKTWTVATPRDGAHRYYLLPEGVVVNCSARDGLDVRGDGGYAALPPSRTQDGEYRVVSRKAMAEATPELIEWAKNRRSIGTLRQGAKRTQAKPSEADSGGPIPEGQRNGALFFEALKLKDAGEDREKALEAVAAINESRCSPPLADYEVEKIVKSAFRYPIRGERTPPEVKEATEAMTRWWWSEAWRGVGGKTERDVMWVLIKMAERYGRLVSNGIRFTFSWRTLSLVAACSFRTVSRVVRRLEERGLLITDNKERSGTEAGAFILPSRLTGITSSNGSTEKETMTASDATSARLPQETPCFRWRGLVGKGRAGVLYALEVYGERTIEELAGHLGWKQVRDLRSRYVVPLVELGLVEDCGGSFALPGDHRARVEEVRDIAYGGGERKVREKDADGMWVSSVKHTPPKSEAEREDQDRNEYESQRKRYRARQPEADKDCVEVLNQWDQEREHLEAELLRVSKADGTVGEVEYVELYRRLATAGIDARSAKRHLEDLGFDQGWFEDSGSSEGRLSA